MRSAQPFNSSGSRGFRRQQQDPTAGVFEQPGGDGAADAARAAEHQVDGVRSGRYEGLRILRLRYGHGARPPPVALPQRELAG